MSLEDMPPCSVTALKEMFGRAVRTVSIDEMNRAIVARGVKSEDTEATPGHTEVRIRPSEVLNHHRAAIRRIVEVHKASKARVFGSVLLGQDTEESDLHILVDAMPGATLFDLVAIQVELEDLLGVAVDVLTPMDLNEKFRARVIEEARSI